MDKDKLIAFLIDRLEWDLTHATFMFDNKYDPSFGDNRECKCSHEYYRHYDSYDDNRLVGCKYCECFTFQEPK